MAPNVNITEKSSNIGPQSFSLSLSAGVVYKLGERYLGDETSSQIAVGDKKKR